MARSRLDPTGKRALFDAPVTAAPDRIGAGVGHDGRAALFSSGPRRAGTVLVTCSRCEARSRISLMRLAVLFAFGSFWAPLLHPDHPNWVMCPACNSRQWCRIGWRD